MKIKSLCEEFERLSEAVRGDKGTRDDAGYEKLSQKTAEITQHVHRLMETIAKSDPLFDSVLRSFGGGQGKMEVLAELTYFNTWAISRANRWWTA